MKTLRMVVRDWDWITPLRVGDVDLSRIHELGINLDIEPARTLPSPLGPGSPDIMEASLSRFVRGWAKGQRELVGTPILMMQAFRQHCIIVDKHSPLHDVAQLTGHRIGLTGWIDSGNTWTRALLLERGIKLKDIRWIAGRLTAQHPIEDRLSGYRVPGWIDSDPQERPMVDMLSHGDLDAIMTPFMPPHFFEAGSRFRFLYADPAAEERRWYSTHRYVPGMHILAFHRNVVNAYPNLPSAVAEALNSSRVLWRTKREKYMDTTPWIIQDFMQEGTTLSSDWNAWNIETQRTMLQEFITQQQAQGLLDPLAAVSIDDMFGEALQ